MVAEPIPINATRRPFRREGLGYVWEIADRGVELRADYITYRNSDLYAQVAITINDRPLHTANYNLSMALSRKSMREELERRTRNLELRWSDIIEQFCLGVIGAERQGQPTQYTSATSKRLTSYIVDYLIIKNKANLLFAPGGSGKGMLCVGLCCAVASKRGLGSLTTQPALPFYFDWEDDFETFNDRLNAVARGMGVEVPSLPYRRMRGLVSDRINEMARAIAEAGATFGVIDSFSAAGGTVSDRGASWDAIAHRLFDALDMVPDVTWLIIDHVTGDKLDAPAGKAYGCYSADTEVLTRRGWVTHAELRIGEPVLTFDTILSACRWDAPTQHHVYPYDGEMVRLKTQNTDVLVTPNHRMVVRPAWGGASPSRTTWEFIEASSLARSDWYTPFGNPVANDAEDLEWIVIGGRQYPADEFIRMVGWWVAEGSIDKRALVLTQARGPLADRMLSTLQTLGLEVNTCTNTNRALGREHEKEMCYMRARKSQDLADWLVEHCGNGAPNKRLPGLAWDLSTRQQEILLEALIDGDGSRGKNGHTIYTTTSSHLAEDVQRLALLVGRPGHVQHAPAQSKGRLDQYVVQISRAGRRALHFTAGVNTTTEQYSGLVHCLTVPTGAYVTRRNGRLAVQGNSIQKMNRARNAWEMRSEQEPGSEVVHMRLFDAKWNHTGKRRPIGIRMDFEGDAVSFSAEDVSATVAQRRATLADRMANELNSGPLSTAILALSLDVSDAAVRSELSRNRERFERNGPYIQLAAARLEEGEDW